MLLPVIASTCFGYHCQEHSLIFFEVCIGAHGLTLTKHLAKHLLMSEMRAKKALVRYAYGCLGFLERQGYFGIVQEKVR